MTDGGLDWRENLFFVFHPDQDLFLEMSPPNEQLVQLHDASQQIRLFQF